MTTSRLVGGALDIGSDAALPIPVGAVGSARVKFDGANLMLSINGAAFTAIATVGFSGWTDDGGVVRLTTATDQVGIGTAAPAAGSQLDVTGLGDVDGSAALDVTRIRAGAMAAGESLVSIRGSAVGNAADAIGSQLEAFVAQGPDRQGGFPLTTALAIRRNIPGLETYDAAISADGQDLTIQTLDDGGGGITGMNIVLLPGSDGVGAFGSTILSTQDVGSVPLLIIPAVGLTADILRITDGAPNDIWVMDINGTLTALADLGDVPRLVLQGNVAQTADVFQCTDNIGTAELVVNANNDLELINAAAAISVEATRLDGGLRAEIIEPSPSAGGAISIGNGAANLVTVDGTGLGFFAVAPIAQPNILGSRAGNAALADLLTKGALLGLWTDGTVV